MSASSIAVIPLVLGLIAIACVVGGIYLIATSRRTVGPGPRCGHCQYNLTGSMANRCPECGRLFIEAGIVTNPVPSLRARRRIGIVLIVLPLVPATLGPVSSLFYQTQRARMQAERARAMAEQARAAEMQARQQAQQAQAPIQNQPTTAPASQPRP